MPEEPDLAEVRLLGVPLRLRERANQHGAELVRELALVQIGAQEHHSDSVPRRLLDVADEVRATYGVFSQQPEDEMEAALDDGREDVDVTYRIPRHVVPFLHRLRGILAEADEYCRHGELLTMAPPADVLAYREWIFEEFERQVAGLPPRPWRDVAAGTGAADAGGERR